MTRLLLAIGVAVLGTLTGAARLDAAEPRLNVLFLGDGGHHQPAARFRQLQPVLAARGIDLAYTDKVSDLNPATLAKYDGLMVFANHEQWQPENEKALLDYVASGKGFIPLHCASYCFIRSQPYIDLVGAQFRSHTTGVFRVENVSPDHPVMKGFESFASWDETYVHHKHNAKERTVLEVRTAGGVKEPWTWVRTHGKGRVFYTAWGHDHRTWSHAGFHALVERGTRWACGQDPAAAGGYIDRPKMTHFANDAKPFEFIPATLPYYPAGERWGTTREPIKQMQKPLPASESIKHYTTPADFEVRPFVTEEKLGGGKPIAMTWDERGRLWLALTLDYPNEMRAEGEGRDKIVVCEDADGDGVCDTVTEFADKLSIPTSLLNAHGGVIVTQAPHTLFLKDTDGDGKADVRQVLFTGWGTRDTHAGPSNLRYGFDNWIYGMVGYSGYVGEVNGEKHKFSQGLFRFKVESASSPLSPPGRGAGGEGKSDRGREGRPLTPNPSPQRGEAGKLAVTKLEFLRSTNNNSWGVAFNEAGELFGSTANGCPLVHLAIPNRYYEKVRGLTPRALPNIALDNHIEPIVKDYRQVDWHGGFTAGAGCAIYTARTYPKEYWNRVAFVSEPTGHLTAAFVLQPNGTDYVAHYGWNLLAGRDDWQAPIDAQVGPDGHMWVIDWYNVIVQHNPTPSGYRTGRGNAYETPLRDKKFGRVYRVVYTKAKAESRIDLKDASAEKLVETLKHHNMGWRLHAQRLLVEGAKEDLRDKLKALVSDSPTDSTGLNASAIHALHTLDGLGQLKNPKQDSFARSVIRSGYWHDSEAVRRATLATWPTDSDGRKLLGEVSADLNFKPEPRMEQNFAYLLTMARLAEAATQEERDQELGRLYFLLSELRYHADPNYRTAGLVAATSHPLAVLSAAISVGQLDLENRELHVVLQRVAEEGARRQPEAVAKLLVKNLLKTNPQVAEILLSGVADGWPAGKQFGLSEDEQQYLGELLPRFPVASRLKLVKLIATWGVKGFDSQITKITQGLLVAVANEKLPPAARLAAAKQVIEFQPESDTAASALVAAAKGAPAELAGGLFEALANSKAKNIGAEVVGLLKDLSPGARTYALRVVLARPDSVAAFLDSVEKGQIRFDLLALDQRTALAAHPDKAIAERAKKLLAQGGGLPDADRQKVIVQLHDVLKKTGDVGLGKKAFVQHCGKCHKHGGEGLQIGPDLTGFAVHPKEEILIHVLDPSRSVEGNYKAYTAKLLDGRVVTGLLSSETRTAVELLDAENKRHAISREDIEELKESVKSLMPEGFEKTMTVEELTNVLEFMTQKGKYVPIPLDKYATAVSTKGLFFEDGGQAERLVFPDWKPKEFKGVPFYLVDPDGDRSKNVILLYGPQGRKAPGMPKSVTLPCNTPAKAIHLLGGIGGWNYPASERGTVSMTVRLLYEDGKTEDHDLKNGEHFADYIRRVDVPGSEFAFRMRGGQQVRYLSVAPKRNVAVKTIEFVKGPDATAPVVVAVTVETP